MIHGGRIHEATGAWLVRCRNLRAGDRIEIRDWNGLYWCHGDPWVVMGESERYGPTDQWEEEYHSVHVYAEECPSEMRILLIRPSDEIKIHSREPKKIDPVESDTGHNQQRKKKPKKGQMSLL